VARPNEKNQYFLSSSIQQKDATIVKGPRGKPTGQCRGIKKAALKESGDTETLCGLAMSPGHRAGDSLGALAPIATRLALLVILVICPLADDVLNQFQDPVILRAIHFLHQRHYLLLIRKTKKVAPPTPHEATGKN
jgi:hypothetical protein